jgi:CheY-like chemotaxis protein
MDVRMPVMNGLEATRQIAQGHETVKVLVLTTFNADEYVYEALRAGASGFLLKDAMPDERLAGIRIVAWGEALLSPRATRLLVEHFTTQARRVPAAPDRLRSLTDRERGRTCTASAPPAPPACSATSATSAGSPAAPTSPRGTAPPRSTPPPATSTGTGCPEPGTGASTAPRTSWPSSSCDTTPRAAATTDASSPPARPRGKPSAP